MPDPTFKWYCSYRDEVEYKVHCHAAVRSLEAYRCQPDMLDHIRKDFNGDADEFERTVVARQGGVIIRFSDLPGYPRWTPEFYRAFTEWLISDHAAADADWKATCARMGHAYEPSKMAPIPRPIYWDEEQRTYLTEPWFEVADHGVNMPPPQGCNLDSQIPLAR
ncbi:hypothetical protein [Edaphobacter modestus]|uniref:Uncharacterized protein n=1 Tax=Edaphobacter modestus TaxID=388466 RepID=A0A4Q7XYU9_9BACT|nr:hypothetical protein [Edaphobacter modestus]RZU28951.1 hypothetical protein BDD14_6537 [Edaphobacter modestus]